MSAIKENKYVYSRFYPEASYEPEHWSQHRIVKITPKFVFVAWLCRVDSIIKLPRHELESNGSVWHKSRHQNRYYSESGKLKFDKEHETIQPVPECLKFFGLSKTSTIKDVKSAYRRLAMKLHPDKGGSNMAFQQLQEQYNYALKMVQV